MAGTDVLALIEEMLDSGRSAEEVCRDCPELLPEVRKRRWSNRRTSSSSFSTERQPARPASSCTWRRAFNMDNLQSWD